MKIRYLMVSVLLLVLHMSSVQAGIFDPEIDVSATKVNLGTVMHSEVPKGSFVIKNKGNGPLILSEVKPSCGCTVVELETKEIAAGKEVEVIFSVDTTGKAGEIRKRITIHSNDPINPEIDVLIYVTVKLQDHQQMDASAIFKGDCAVCHAEPAQYLEGEELFEAVCYMCHGHYGLGGYAARINDYVYVSSHTDEEVRDIIAKGMPNTSMPAFEKKSGGPLSESQIDSLVKLFRWWEEGFIFKENEKRLEE